jgi:hypothetical protein
MKMPEPVGYLSQYNLTMLEQGYPQTIVMLKGAKRDLPIYSKQALIDLLEAAAVECEDTEIVDGKGYYMQGGDAVATQRNIATAIRKLKETL